MDQAIHQTHKQTQRLFSFFSENRSSLVHWIQLDRKWFEPWVADHAPPPGVELVPVLGRPAEATRSDGECDAETA
jgi:hypothetical protein